MRAHKRTLRHSVCGRRGASLLKPLRRAAGDPAGRETHVNTLGCLCDSGWLAGWLTGCFCWASQDGQGTASRGTASGTRTSSTPHAFTSDVNTQPWWGSRRTCAPSRCQRGIAALCSLVVTGRATVLYVIKRRRVNKYGERGP